jgi:hypothetical protein
MYTLETCGIIDLDKYMNILSGGSLNLASYSPMSVNFSYQ